jgi:uncharacterized membrane protein YeaQ/YmgE (transglycosylase-associated protein family)
MDLTHLDLTQLIIFLLVGLIAGWLAGKLIRGGGYGLLGDMVIGVLGAVIGGVLLPKVGLGHLITIPILNQIVVATIGAVILLLALRLLKH